MRLAFRYGLVLLSAVVLYLALFRHLRVAGVAVDVFLLLAVVGGLICGPDRGAVIGFTAGLTLDLLGQWPLGLLALNYCLIGFVAGRYQASVVRSSRSRLMVTTGVFSALGWGLTAVVGWMLNQRNMISDHLPVVLVVLALANGLLAPIVARALRWAWDEPVGRPFAALR